MVLSLWKKSHDQALCLPPFSVHQKIKPTENTQTEYIRNNDLNISKDLVNVMLPYGTEQSGFVTTQGYISREVTSLRKYFGLYSYIIERI